jgi:hypothetical protein
VSAGDSRVRTAGGESVLLLFVACCFEICLETSGFVKGYKLSIRIIGDKLCIGNRISLLKPFFLEKVIK